MNTHNDQAISIRTFLNPYLSKSKLFLLVFFITCLFAAFEQSLQAYFIKLVIDTVSSVEPEALLYAVLLPAMLYVGMDLYHNLTMRAYLYACMKYFPRLKNKVMYDLFSERLLIR